MRLAIPLSALLVFLSMAVSASACGTGTCQEPAPSHIGNNPGRTSASPVVASTMDVRWRYDRFMTGQPVTLTPERTIWIRISSTDINRIACMGGEITDATYSKEKGAMVKVKGREAFLKLKALKKQDGTVRYSENPVDVYISCAGRTYGFIGRPKRIPSKTIYLVDPASRMQKAMKTLNGQEIDRAVVGIVKKVYRDVIPSYWERQALSVKEAVAGANVVGRVAWHIPGTSLRVEVFDIHNPGRGPLVIEEKDLLDPGLAINPIAIAVRNQRLNPGESTMGIIIEKRVD